MDLDEEKRLMNTILKKSAIHRIGFKKVKEKQLIKIIDDSSALLEKATNDLLDSEILYKNNRYSNSIYLLQQAVEKTAKSYGIITGIIKSGRTIGHRSPLVFAEIIKAIYREFKPQIPIPKYIGIEDAIKNNDEKSIRFLLNAKREFIETWLDLTDAKIKKDAKEDPHLEALSGIHYLYQLSIITYLHFDTTRYPNSGLLNPNDYQKGLGIVDAYFKVAKATILAAKGVAGLINIQRYGIATARKAREVLPEYIKMKERLAESKNELDDSKRRLEDAKARVRSKKFIKSVLDGNIHGQRLGLFIIERELERLKKEVANTNKK